MPELSRYDYQFPQDLIAQAPARPRDSARLLVYDRKRRQVSESTFLHLADFLPPKSVIVFNRTRVIPARFSVTKDTGGRADLLYVSTDGDLVRVMSNRRLAVGSTVVLSGKLSFAVVGQPDRFYLLRPSFPVGRLHLVLEKYGRAPLPPYIKESPLSEPERRREYQTVFARDTGSIAAPTASLHFSRRLLGSLKRSGHDIRYVTLHVGLGTFAPLTDDNLKRGRLHREEYRITPAAARFLDQAKAAGRPIIAVGTTVCRALESAAGDSGRLVSLSGSTDLFVREGYRFRFVDGLVTNFHVPKSSLMMLVAAMTGREELMGIYGEAVRRRFRLFSFGDGMLVS
ncbi:tRNA preQ1(34) S-adenosylmethionine ribosyltransferase-isomerase QueA [Candidatus Uhrbacteria bacterium]|nr:tRNA preQ1(34) S-adenosylmethionine ribosyltransferase-isomerase QueA [Candidatus Uhrbacteria bacterium]